MSRDNPIYDKRRASPIVAPLPALPRFESPNLEGSIHFRICERFVAPVAPAEPPEHSDLPRKLLLEIQSESVFVAALLASSNNIRRRVSEFSNAICLFIVSHVRMIEINQQTHHASAMHEKISARLRFKIL